ncbi:MAG TPA: hypothetical protein VMC10_25815 [Stellaceae bacterium]|nr:hypothetical protein [Stellaceae bacterium]
MRKLFIALGIVFAVILVAGTVGLFVLARNGAALDAESKAYVDDAVIAITAHWKKDEFMKRATPQLLQSAKPKALDDLFDAAGFGLGPLVEYRGAQGQSLMSATTGTGTVISANYVAEARFQKGTAAIHIALLKIDGVWMINGFNIESTDMMSNLAGKKT